MIIDCILDRKDCEARGYKDYYDAHNFYIDMMRYNNCYGEAIARAMDFGSEEDVKRELKEYIDDCDYRSDIKEYIDSVNWL